MGIDGHVSNSVQSHEVSMQTHALNHVHACQSARVLVKLIVIRASQVGDATSKYVESSPTSTGIDAHVSNSVQSCDATDT